MHCSFTLCRGLMCLGSIAVFRISRFIYHGIIRIGYRSIDPRCALHIKRIIAICLNQFFVMYPCFSSSRSQIWFSRTASCNVLPHIGGLPTPFAPPVIDGTRYTGASCTLSRIFVIQFLEASPYAWWLLRHIFIKQRNRICNGRVDRRIIRKTPKHWWYRNRTDNRFLHIFIFLRYRSQIRVIFQKSCHIPFFLPK